MVKEKKILRIDITKSSETNTFYTVYATESDDTKHRLIIINNDKFIQDIENIQKSNVKSYFLIY